MSLTSAILLVAGVVVYGFTMWDVLKTTLSMHGGAPLTDRLMRAIDGLIARAGDKGPRERPPAIARYSNLLLTVTLFVMWFSGLLLAATLMLASDESSVTQVAESNDGAAWLNRLYFVGASLTTAGFGDFVPNGVYWQALTVVMATSGLVVTSLGISYVVSIVSAVAAQRALARRITHLGRCPRDILALYHRGGEFAGLGAGLASLAGELVTHTQRHLAYPAIHYVRADDDRDCLPAAVALLDETLTILLYDVPAAALPPVAELAAVRRAVTGYLESLRAGFVDDLPSAPPYPPVDFLYEDFGLLPEGRARRLDREDADRFERRRRLLRAGTDSQGIHWARLGDYLETPREDRLDGDAIARLTEAPGAPAPRLTPHMPA